MKILPWGRPRPPPPWPGRNTRRAAATTRVAPSAAFPRRRTVGAGSMCIVASPPTPRTHARSPLHGFVGRRLVQHQPSRRGCSSRRGALPPSSEPCALGVQRERVARQRLLVPRSRHLQPHANVAGTAEPLLRWEWPLHLARGFPFLRGGEPPNRRHEC